MTFSKEDRLELSETERQNSIKLLKENKELQKQLSASQDENIMQGERIVELEKQKKAWIELVLAIVEALKIVLPSLNPALEESLKKCGWSE